MSKESIKLGDRVLTLSGIIYTVMEGPAIENDRNMWKISRNSSSSSSDWELEDYLLKVSDRL